MSSLQVLGPLAMLGDHVRALEPSAIAILASSRRHLPAVVHALAAYETHVFDRARVHVPIEVVEEAEAMLVATGANVIVAIGGGSPIGLGKALKHRAAQAGRALRFVAVPTTYAGSEHTSMYGITRGRDKQTGRDDRVRPDLILADVELTLDLPLVLTVQSMLNAVAHVASVLSTQSLPEKRAAPPDEDPSGITSADAATSARTVIAIIAQLIANPRDAQARTDAVVYAGTCARAFDRGKAGVQHAFAHLLGGAFGVDHAALHSILLPRFLAANRAVRERIELAPHAIAFTRAFDRLDAHVLELLAHARAPTTLGALGITRAALDEVLATRPELPGDIARAAL